MAIRITTDVTVVDKSAWVSNPASDQTHTGFATLRNSSDGDLSCAKVESPDYHEISIRRTVAGSEPPTTEKVHEITIPAEGEFALDRDGCHLRLERPTHTLAPGDHARLLFFLSDGTILKTRMPLYTTAYGNVD
ncbi:copper chaperone PCu(A)C [Embleya sp. NPDC056575]|uniref:copper chaperone PCu(A)C n=1 Tax=unclassified Embleya TaxID=2699296 RepID=UPI00369F3622